MGTDDCQIIFQRIHNNKFTVERYIPHSSLSEIVEFPTDSKDMVIYLFI